MSVIKEIAEQESQRQASGVRNELHLYREGTFLRAYEWSAWLACRFLHEFKVNKRLFKGVDEPVVFIGFPEGSLPKWMPEGVEQEALDEKHLVLRLPPMLLSETEEAMGRNYAEWRESVPLTAAKERSRREADTSPGGGSEADGPATLTGIMQRVLAFPIESKSPLESMSFLADVKLRLASII